MRENVQRTGGRVALGRVFRPNSPDQKMARVHGYLSSSEPVPMTLKTIEANMTKKQPSESDLSAQECDRIFDLLTEGPS